MTKAAIGMAAAGIALAVIVLTLLVRYSAPAPRVGGSAAGAAESPDDPGFIYGRVVDVDGRTYEGRLRWGGNQEAFWGHYFDGAKSENPWADHVARTDSPIEIFGIEFGGGDRPAQKQFLARFGDIARIEADFREVQVTLKSGTTVRLDRFAAGDIDDGLRVWDVKRGVVDLDTRTIRTIEFLPRASAQPSDAAGQRLHGTVVTSQGRFTGFVQWNRNDSLLTDQFTGRTDSTERSVPYGTIRAIARRTPNSVDVTLTDGSRMVLSDTSDVGSGHGGVHIEDARYGGVLVPWSLFERLEFSAGGSSRAYADFSPGRALAGSVTTRDGRRLTGRLVYDLDESETTDTLDATAQGVTYNIPFDRVSSIVPQKAEADGVRRATVTLRGGETLEVERSGDLSDSNAGLLVFVDGGTRPEFVAWPQVDQILLD